MINAHISHDSESRHIPAGVGGEDGERHALSELLCDVLSQRRSVSRKRFYTLTAYSFVQVRWLIQTQMKKVQHVMMMETLVQTLYLGKTLPGPGSSGPGTNTKRLLQKHIQRESVKSITQSDSCFTLCVKQELQYIIKLSCVTVSGLIKMSYLLWMLGNSQIRSASALKESENNIVTLWTICFPLKRDCVTAKALKRWRTFESSELVPAVRSGGEIPTKYEAGGRHGRVACNDLSQSVAHIHIHEGILQQWI